jgi:O-antigen/teichoic acid export membrane protein
VIFYSLASTLVSYVSSLCSNITQVFTPRFTQLESSDSFEELQELYFTGVRMAGMVVTALVAGLLVFGKDFIRLWVGASYVNGPWTDRSDIIMAVLILANLPRMLQGISWQRLYGTGRVRFLMWLNICEAAFNLILSVYFARRFGPVGVALGTFFPLIVSQMMIMPVYSCRIFKISIPQFLRRGLALPIITGILMSCVNWVCIMILPPATWQYFAIDVLIAVILGVFICLGIGVTKKERNEFFARLKIKLPVIS